MTSPPDEIPDFTSALRASTGVACRSCRRIIDRADTFCRYCGWRQVRSTPWYYKPVWILLLTLTVLGPFSIPLVLRSPLMNRKQKIAANVAIALFSAFLIAALYRLFIFMLDQWRSIGSVFDDMNI